MLQRCVNVVCISIYLSIYTISMLCMVGISEGGSRQLREASKENKMHEKCNDTFMYLC